ncbi:MAG: NAD-dependent epimerase/dehydratase family protein, partial [bacterium]
MEDLALMPSFWAGRKALVTGATGLVGSWLVRELLKRGASVAALVAEWDPASQLLRSGDAGRTARVTAPIEDAAAVLEAVRAHAPEAVFHLAARTQVGAAVRDPLATLETTVGGPANVLEACRVQAGTVRRV